ncbi:hypothetical protein HPB48_022738 [Haemaphysalis longicornis]|uniref:Uncharacterized protein n=1 Tax=Haemaphysalis longicornis TaxID=44386 RepID=A0A9J6GGD8_HAELO|nr:hypothetical protein HPB48_022738 [Haemaphysalis longicornis]
MFTPNLLVFVGNPVPSIKASILSLIAGFRERTVKEHIKCSVCVERLKEPGSSRPAAAMIFNLDRGGLSYPRLKFICALERAAQSFAELAVYYKKPTAVFVKTMLLAALENKIQPQRLNGGSYEGRC